MAQYYVNSASTGSGDGTTTATTGAHAAFATLAEVNAKSFAAGDSCLFNKGQYWLGTLTIPTSGSAGNAITFGSYGTGVNPVIHGTTILASGSWTDLGSNVWGVDGGGYTPLNIYFNGTKGTSHAHPPVGALQWAMNGTVIEVYSVGNPATTYTSPGVEIPYLLACDINDKDYITIQNIDFIYGRYWGNITVRGGSINTTIDGVTSTYAEADGIHVEGNTSDSVIKNCTTHHNAAVGIQLNECSTTAGHENYIQDNTCYTNGQDGILGKSNYTIIQRNTAYGNGTALLATSGIRIFDNLAGDGSWGSNNKILRNKSYSNMGSNTDGSGIEIDHYTDNNEVSYNLVYNNYGSGIIGYKTAGALIYNNTCYSNAQNASISLKGEIVLWDDALDRTTATVKNNVAYSTVTDGFAIQLGEATILDNAITITNNCWYRTSGNWYYWGGTLGSNLATWNAYALVGTDINSDPLFRDAVNSDFHILPGSPCIGAGANVGLTSDIDGMPIV